MEALGVLAIGFLFGTGLTLAQYAVDFLMTQVFGDE